MSGSLAELRQEASGILQQRIFSGGSRTCTGMLPFHSPRLCIILPFPSSHPGTSFSPVFLAPHFPLRFGLSHVFGRLLMLDFAERLEPSHVSSPVDAVKTALFDREATKFHYTAIQLEPEKMN